MSRISWDTYFMSIAKLASLRSCDPNTKVGAIIVDNHHHIIATGYNGFPTGIDESQLPLEKKGNYLNTKYPYILHAEANAILNATVQDLTNSILYVTLFPCNECTKLILQKGIKEIVYLEDKYPNSDSIIASKKLLDLSEIYYRQLADFSFPKI